MMNKKTLFIVLALVAVITITYAVNVNAVANSIPAEDYGINLKPPGTMGMDWTLEDIRTETMITFSSFEGKLVLLDFFSIQFPQSENFAKELRDVRAAFSTSKLEMISVNIAPYSDSVIDILNFVSVNQMNWHIVLDTVDMYTFYELPPVPNFYLFNVDQRIVFANDVITDSEYLINKINEYIDNVSEPGTNTGTGTIPDFWSKNWYWFVIGGVFLIISVALTIQRVRVVNHNKKVRQQRLEEKQRRHRQRNR